MIEKYAGCIQMYISGAPHVFWKTVTKHIDHKILHTLNPLSAMLTYLCAYVERALKMLKGLIVCPNKYQEITYIL